MTTYIVNFNPEVDLPIYRNIRKKNFRKRNYPVSTLVGVSTLGEWLIEIEAIAIVQ
jgi:enamine deaminase RidA (YjgF/YER057c/UK114 family)